MIAKCSATVLFTKNTTFKVKNVHFKLFNQCVNMIKVLVALCILLKMIDSDNKFFEKFHQHDYDVTFTWAEVVSYNKTIFKNVDIHTFKYNRSLTAANATFEYNVEVDDRKILVRIQAYKFLSNEYRKVPHRFQVNLCDAVFDHNLAGSREILRCGNVKECNTVKGKVYHICNAYPDESRLPPLVPNGEFKIEGALIYQDLAIAVVNLYGKVSRRVKFQ